MFCSPEKSKRDARYKTSAQFGAVDKVPEIKRQGRFQARKKMPFGITLSVESFF